MPTGYTRIQIALHWLIFLLIGFQLIFGDAMSHAWRDYARTGSFEPSLGVVAHVWVGIAVLALVLFRFAIKAKRGAPPLPENEHPLLKLSAHLMHYALYALMVLIPVSGMVAWFGDQRWAGDIHELMKPAIIILVLLHVAGALYQHFVLKSDVLMRMRTPER